MTDSYIFEGKTTTEAVEKGLKELGLKKTDVEIIPVKSEEKRSFFSILEPRIVKVEIKVKQKIKENNTIRVEKEKKELSEAAVIKAKKNIEEFLNVFLKQVSAENLLYEISEDKYYIYVKIKGEKTNNLIGYRGETLNALQTLLSAVSNKEVDEKVRVILDISLVVILGFNKIDIQSPEPLGEDQILPLVPLPFVCSSEITIVPSG